MRSSRSRTALLALLVAISGACSDQEPPKPAMDEATFDALYRQGEMLVSEGRAEDARKLFERLKAADPFDLRVYSAIRRIHDARGDHDAALAEIGAAERLLTDPEDRALVLLERAHHLSDRGQTRAAMASLDEAIRLHPTEHELYLQRGILHEQAGRTEAALADYRETLRRKETCPLGHMNLGALHARAERDDLAERHMKRAIALRPDDPGPLAQLATFYRSRGRDADLARVLEQMEAAEPGSVRRWRERVSGGGAAPRARHAPPVGG